MKKYVKLLLFMLLVVTVNVKADYSSTGVVVNNTTVYKGDTINLKLGNDYMWDGSLVASNFDEDEKKIEYVKTADNTYLVEPIYIVVDSNIFELNIDENKLQDDNYIFTDFKKITYNDKNVYEFDFELKKLRDVDNDSTLYDGVIDHILLSNLKLKVNDEAQAGTYNIEVLRAIDFYDEYESEINDVESLPITIIDNGKENSLKNYTLQTISDGLVDTSAYNLNVEKNEYDLMIYGDVVTSNLSCNTRCNVSGIGSDVYRKRNVTELKYNIKYENGKTDTFVVNNRLNKASIVYNWANSFSKSIIIISNSSYNNANDLAQSIAANITYFEGGFETNIYNYDELNDIDKEILSKLNKSFTNLDKPYIYVVDDGKVLYEHQGELSEEELSNLQSEINVKRRENYASNNSEITNCDDETCKNNDTDKKDLKDILKNNVMYLVIMFSVLIILIILLITIIKKNKKRENIF